MNAARAVAAAMLTLVALPPGTAQEHQHASVAKLGEVHFATSCNEPAQVEFDRAIALLHSFQFSLAIEGFRAALAADSSCAIAWWGIGLSDWGNPFAPGAKSPAQLQLGRDGIDSGLLLGAKTTREQDYLTAVGHLYKNFEGTPQLARVRAYRDSMEHVASQYPEDQEAQTFYALALAAGADPGDKTYSDQIKAGAILEKLFELQPMHPGLAHYIIHAYDVPALAGRALGAAQRYAAIAPDAPHALHMPSHTFTRLGYWEESVASNVAAAAAARRQGQTAEELHASDYEVFAYLQTGQDQAAQRILSSLPEISARFDPNVLLAGAGPPAAAYFAMAAIPARYALERQDWQAARQLKVQASPFPYTSAVTWFARGLGAARLQRRAEAEEAARELDGIRERLVAAKETYWARQVEIQAKAIEAWSILAAGNRAQALQRLQSAAALEDGTEKSAVTPGSLVPVRELLGEMYLQMQEPAEALRQFELTLDKEPRRFRSLFGAAHSARLAGIPETSRRYFRQLLEVCARGDQPGRPELGAARKALAAGSE